MKRILGLLLFISLSASAYAQSSLVAKRNDNAATVLAPTNLQLSALAVDERGSLFTSQNVAAQTATIDMTNAAATATFNCSGYGSAAISASAGITGTLYPQKSVGGVNYNDVAQVIQWTGGGYYPSAYQATGFGSGGEIIVDCSGAQYIRIRVAVVGTGTATVTFSPKIAAMYQMVTGIYPSGQPGGGFRQEDAAHVSSEFGIQALAVRNDGAVTSISGTNGDYTPIAVSGVGSIFAGAFHDPNITSPNRYSHREDTAAASGDAGILPLAVYQASPGNLVGTDGDYAPISTNGVGAVVASIYRSGASTDPVKAESSTATSGDAGVQVLGVRNTSLNATAAQGEYQAIATGTSGNVLNTIVFDSNIATASTPVRAEDSLHATSDTGNVILGVVRDPLPQIVGALNDYGNPSLDFNGRTITTLAPAGETWQSCTPQITNTSDAILKANVASNRNYITSLTCTNRSAVASSFVLKDGSTTIFIGGVGTQAATGGIFNQTFPVPLRSTSNTAFNIAMSTTATDTFCCASGYISVN
jgi:hypothetical protein